MPDVKWTDEQRTAIEDNKHNLLVSAAAGSGKTAVLVEHILELIKSGKANIDEMLIVTFTNAAASEMRERIFRQLKACNLDYQIERMGKASISSLDSFAFSVVKRYYHIIGADPGLRVCDNTGAALLKEDALDELFEKEFAASNNDFLYFLDCYDHRDDNDDSVRSMILKLHTFLMSMPHPWDFADKCCNADEAAAQKLFDFASDRSLQLLKRAEEYHNCFISTLELNGLTKQAEKAKEDLSFVQSLADTCEKNPELAFKLILEKPRSKSISLKKTDLEGREDEIKAIRDHANELLNEIKKSFGGLSKELLIKEQSAMKDAVRILFDLVIEFDKIYAEKKAAEKQLDFSDMNHFAIEILASPEVCEEYRNQYKYIFIDEFQDTNSVQETIINSISRSNNLFMVGDVKQSIYKFRLAEPEIFLKLYDEYKSGKDDNSRLIDLNCNFRSKASVINAVNDVFSKLMTRESCEIEYDDAASLKLGSSYNGNLNYPVQLRILDAAKHDNDDALVTELRRSELEALQIASIIKEYHGKTIHDDKTDLDRPLEYRDMVILLRGTKNNGELYYRTLLNCDIPVYLDRSEGYFDTIEIQVFLNLLKLINNSRMDIPLLSVLSCPVFGFSAEELAMVRIYGNEVLKKPDAPFWEVFYKYAETDPKAEAFTRLINGYRKDASVMPLADFIFKLLLETGYGDFASAQNNGEQRLANLKALVDKAEHFEKDNLTGLSGFIRFVEIIAKNSGKIDIGPAKTIGENANCVKIMTIHKSKGLEFPFVLAAGLAGSTISKTESSDYAFHKELGCAIKPVNPKTKAYSDTRYLSIINMKKSLEARAEEVRIMYVAFTRAIDILVFSACKSISEKNTNGRMTILPGDIDSASYHLDMIQPCLALESIKYTNKNSLAAFVKLNEATREAFRQEMEELWPDADDEEVIKIINYPYFRTEKAPKKKYSVSELAERERLGFDKLVLAASADDENEEIIRDGEDELYEVPLFISGGQHKLNAAEKGNAYHTVMQHIPFTDDGKSLDEIKAFIRSLADKNIISEETANFVKAEKIKAFFDSDIGKRAVRSNELHREAPFVMTHELDGHSVLVQGTIDCYFKEDDRYVLIDYKSNYIDLTNKEIEYNRIQEMYIPQLKLYRDAIERISGIKLKEAVLYLFGTNESITVELGE